MHVGPTGCLTGSRGIAACLTDLLGILAHAGQTESNEKTRDVAGESVKPVNLLPQLGSKSQGGCARAIAF